MFSEKISVVIPTYLRSNMLKRAINSVLNQTYQNFEIIIVDDNGVNSTEQLETEKILLPLLKDERIIYIKNKVNLGGSKTRNAGIFYAKGKYITFLDDDDEYYPDKLEKQIIFYHENFPKDDGFINAQIDVYKKEKKIRTTKNCVNYDEILFSSVSEKILGTPTFFIPREILNEIGGFPDISKGQEWYLSVILISKGYKFLSMNLAIVKVNIHDQGSVFDANFDVSRQIAGLNRIFDIQNQYFNKFSYKQKRYIKHKYCLGIARAHSKKSISISFYWLLKSLLYSLPKKEFLTAAYRVIIK